MTADIGTVYHALSILLVALAWLVIALGGGLVFSLWSDRGTYREYDAEIRKDDDGTVHRTVKR